MFGFFFALHLGTLFFFFVQFCVSLKRTLSFRLVSFVLIALCLFRLFVRLVLSTFFLFCLYVTLVLSALSFLFVCYISSNRAVVSVCFYINSSLALSFLFVFYTSCKRAMSFLFVCHVSCNRSLSFLFVCFSLSYVGCNRALFFLLVCYISTRRALSYLFVAYVSCNRPLSFLFVCHFSCKYVLLFRSFFFVHCKCVVFKCIEIRPRTPPF